MKRIFIFSLAIMMVGTSFSYAGSAPKKDKKQGKTTTKTVLVTQADSLSYASGVEATEGLIPFIQQSYNVDTAYMADFIAGYKEAFKTASTPQGKARVAGMQIAQMVSDRILPGTKEMLKTTVPHLSDTLFNQGFTDVLAKDTTLFSMKGAKAYKATVLSKAGEEFLAENAKKPGVQVLPDGLQYKVLVAGNGPIPKASDEVEVVYEGRTIDGKVFDSTAKHGSKTDKFRANGLIKGWTEALTLMPVGSKWEVYIPQELGYGSRRAGQIPPYSTLIFDLELKGIVPPKAKEEPKTTPSSTANTSKTAGPAKTAKPATVQKK